MIPIKKIYPHPDNPRKALGDISELADSIRKNGVLQNLTVIEGHYTKDGFADGAYTAIIGHRRLAAAREAGLEEVPCVIKQMDRKEQVQTMLLENIQRSDLTVYEQAQGFQMMLDLGSTIEEVSQKTGFSETTVRRRVKMMELDQSTLKAVSERQLALSDFDRLAQIRDIKERNKVLEKIGTNDFNMLVSGAINRQKAEDNKAVAFEWLEAHKAKEITASESWKNIYERVAYISLYRLGEDGDRLPENIKEGEPLFYNLDYTQLRIFRKAKKAAPAKRSPEELEKERAEKQAAQEYERLSGELYDLRKTFVDEFKISGRAREWIYVYALRVALLSKIEYASIDYAGLKAIFGIEPNAFNQTERIAERLPDLTLADEFRCVLALFNDSKNNDCSTTRSGYPQYKKNYMLELYYDFLEALGYEASTEEQAYVNGSHELYQRGKAK